MSRVGESTVEAAAFAWLETVGWRLRDALLPKLITGELQVKDAERFLKERELC